MKATKNFFANPILNSPYEAPTSHWELDGANCPTNKIISSRRPVSLITPIPRPKGGEGTQQRELVFDAAAAHVETASQQYTLTTTIESIRNAVRRWRELRDPRDWGVTHETARLLQHWRNHNFSTFRPFFCQVEAAETIIWLTEVASPRRKSDRQFLDKLITSSEDANPGLHRTALKMATGTGKTTVMAMLIAWQTINAIKHPQSNKFTNGFLIVTPGLTVRDRLRVLQPNDPESYYDSRGLVPPDMLLDLHRARITITNFHAFKKRDQSDFTSAGKALLTGRGPEIDFLESDGQMLQRVISPLLGMRRILVFNDEAHHCYRERPAEVPGEANTDAIDEAGQTVSSLETQKETARLWISGLETIKKSIDVSRIIDFSATPFFLAGSGYAEGTLFPWTVYDFSLMDAIECGIVKLPRVPVADNIKREGTKQRLPLYRYLWDEVGSHLPTVGRHRLGTLDPNDLPIHFKNALATLYTNYEKVFDVWDQAGTPVPPCFIVICNSTATSKVVYDYIAGYQQAQPNGESLFHNGQLKHFRNFDDFGTPLPRPHTLLIDSEQLESGEALHSSFRQVAHAQIEQFHRDNMMRNSNVALPKRPSDEQLLREVMNTVGKPGRLGESIRCVVSVSMLTEGWDANTVTHILGVRAFGTQLLCEQAIGRALRRYSYELNDEKLLDVEYADIFGIPFDFTAKPGPPPPPPPPPPPRTRVHAVRPTRDHCEIRYPRVLRYKIELPEDILRLQITPASILELTPEFVGATRTRNEGIVGSGIDMTIAESHKSRRLTIVYCLTRWLVLHFWHDKCGYPKLHQFGRMKQIVNQWLSQCLLCRGDTTPALLLFREIADAACEKIRRSIVSGTSGAHSIAAVLDPNKPIGSTAEVNFFTPSTQLFATGENKCHVNYVVCDSSWEDAFCSILERHPKVMRYVKNSGFLEVPYLWQSTLHYYWPDFIVDINDRDKGDDPLHLVVEIKGYRRDNVKAKHQEMCDYWLPAVNKLEQFGRWQFLELNSKEHLQRDFDSAIDHHIGLGASCGAHHDLVGGGIT